MATAQLDPKVLTLDPELQQRESYPPNIVDEYTEAYKAGAEFPPLTVYYDGEKHWVSNGFLRTQAAILAKQETVKCDVRKGSRDEALLDSLAANETHGVRRTYADRRKAIIKAFSLPGNANAAANAIAQLCGVSTALASTVKKEVQEARKEGVEPPPATVLDGQPLAPDEIAVKRGGKTFKMKKGRIGKGATGRKPGKGGVKEAEQAEKSEAADKPVEDKVTGKPVEGPVKETFFAAQISVGALIRVLSGALDKLKELQESKSGAWLGEGIDEHIKAARKAIKEAYPHTVHDKCEGKGCKVCHKSGFLNKATFESLPTEERA